MKTEPTIINLDDIEGETGGGMLRKTLISPSTTGTSCLRVSWVNGTNGSGRPKHTHDGDETLFVLGGAATLTVGGVEYGIKANDAVVIPAGAEHSLLVTGEQFIAVTSFCDECEARYKAPF